MQNDIGAYQPSSQNVGAWQAWVTGGPKGSRSFTVTYWKGESAIVGSDNADVRARITVEVHLVTIASKQGLFGHYFIGRG